MTFCLDNLAPFRTLIFPCPQVGEGSLPAHQHANESLLSPLLENSKNRDVHLLLQAGRLVSLYSAVVSFTPFHRVANKKLYIYHGR
jgi:hypothetical protein